jgi:hypothetical protein
VRAIVRLEHAWIALALVATFVGPASSPVVMLDLGWTLRSGMWMVEHRQLLASDPFTSAPAVPTQLDMQWLAQLVYYAVYRAGDLPLVIAANAVVVTLAYGLVLAACVAVSGRPRLACAAIVPAYVLGFTNLAPRPQTLAYPLFGLFLLALERAHRSGGARWLWLLSPAMVVWANVHGSFFLGVLLVGCFAVGAALEARSLRAGRPHLLALLGCVLAACLTPYGPGSLWYVVGIASNPIVRGFVGEWAPTSIGSTEGVLFFASVLGLLALGWRRSLRATEVLVLVVFGCLGLTAVRSVVWWGMASAPVVARLLASLAPRPAAQTRQRPLLNVALLGLLGSLVVVSLPWVRAAYPLLPDSRRALIQQEVPPELVAFLEEHSYPGLMLTHQGWGGYFDWRLWPTHQPFLDGRFELHPPAVWLDYLAMTAPRADWQVLTDRYGIGYMVLWKRAEGGLIAAARTSDGWRIDYEDDQAVVLVRVFSGSPAFDG